jgi:uncharacterized protein (DUF1697 family)
MTTYIALLRGINVGGRNRLPMKELRSLLQGLGYENVKTYIQSGNVVFESDETDVKALSHEISTVIAGNYDFEPRVMVLTAEEVEAAAAGNPYPEAESAPKTVHLGFLDSEPTEPDLEKLESFRKENERFELREKVFYMHAPDGVGRSKLAANSERLLGVPMTSRNWRTISKILEMI